jgi:hypothetical protein
VISKLFAITFKKGECIMGELRNSPLGVRGIKKAHPVNQMSFEYFVEDILKLLI